jgi:hypothetical protein
VRVGGNNNNGGSSTSLAAERTGTDGVGNGTSTYTSASANFTSADVGKGFSSGTGSSCNRRKIIAVVSSTTITLNTTVGSASGLTWAIGGAWADHQPAFLVPAVTNGTGSGIVSGDSVYIGAGTYRFIVSQNLAPSFNGVVSYVGDVTGQFTGDAGMVQLTAYTTNDKTAPSATTLLNLNGKSNLAFSNIMFVGGNATIVTATTATSQNITWRDCAWLMGFTANQVVVTATCGYQIPFNWLFDRCLFTPSTVAQALVFTLTTGSGSQDYDANVLFENTLFIATGATSTLRVTNSGVLAQKGGGIRSRSCTLIGQEGGFMSTVAAQISTVFPSYVYDSFLMGLGTLIAGTLGQIVEDYNLIISNTPRTNVTAGTHSISDGSYAPLFHFGQERIWLPPLFRAFGEPMAGSPLLGFGNDGGQTPYDLRGSLWQRPAGSSSALPAVGAMERSDTFIADPSPIGPDTSPVKITGPGYNDFLLPIGVTEVGQTRNFSVETQWDANYASSPTAPLPTAILVGKPQMGITQQVVSATGSSGSPHTITLASFTPSASGVLQIRLASYDLSGSSVVEFDGFTVT